MQIHKYSVLNPNLGKPVSTKKDEFLCLWPPPAPFSEKNIAIFSTIHFFFVTKKIHFFWGGSTQTKTFFLFFFLHFLLNTNHSSMNYTEPYLIERRTISPLFPLLHMVSFSTLREEFFPTKTTAPCHLKYILIIIDVINSTEKHCALSPEGRPSSAKSDVSCTLCKRPWTHLDLCRRRTSIRP